MRLNTLNPLFDMKKLTLIIAAAAVLCACSEQDSTEKDSVKKEETTENQESKTDEEASVFDENGMAYFGDEITPDDAIPATELRAQLEGKDSLVTKVSGTIIEACKKKGCWMTVDIGNDDFMRVRFKDYGFFVPKNSDGMEMVMEGVAFMDTTSVDHLKHLAEDAGKSQEEIDAIDAPELNLAFEATGVIIKE